MKRIFRAFSTALAALSLFAMGFCAYAAQTTPDEISICPDGVYSFGGNSAYSLSFPESAEADCTSDSLSTKAEMKLFGILPVKSVDVHLSDRQIVTLGGKPFGIRLYTDGLVVSKTSAVPVENGVRTLLRRLGKHVPSVSLLDTWDMLEPGAFMFILFTKVRCLAAGCCYGIPCSWGIYNWVAKEKTFPVQILEILLTATILLVVYRLKRKPFFRRGMALFLAAIIYSCGRFFLEYWKYYVPEDHCYHHLRRYPSLSI